MKNLLLSSFLLLITVTLSGSDKPLKTTTLTAFSGACAAGLGLGLKKGIDYSLANYSFDMPTIITPTKESSLLLIGFGALGGGLVLEKLYCDKTTSFDDVLPIENKSIKLRVGKALTLTILSESLQISVSLKIVGYGIKLIEL